MSLFKNRDQYSDAPKFVVNAATGDTGQEQFGNTVFGASVAETAVTKSIAHAGWIRRVEGTGGRAGRVQVETLVAMSSITTDATDFANTDTADVATTIGTADDTTLPDA